MGQTTLRRMVRASRREPLNLEHLLTSHGSISSLEVKSVGNFFLVPDSFFHSRDERETMMEEFLAERKKIADFDFFAKKKLLVEIQFSKRQSTELLCPGDVIFTREK